MNTGTNHRRGHVRAPNKDAMISSKFVEHRHMLRRLRSVVPPASYDVRQLSWFPPYDDTEDDQGQCGDCWEFSGVGVAEAALMMAGVLQPSQRISRQYGLDCQKSGECNGDDNTTALEWSKQAGNPLTSVYGSYQGGPSKCKSPSGMVLYKIDDWGFADGSGGNGVTAVADIKAAILEYGLVGCGVAAGNDWNNVGPTTTITGRGTNIDHDVAIGGWDDNHDNGDGSKGAWLVKNNWGPSWGNNGWAWIKYGADSIGTETVWAVKASIVPPPPPPPPPPPAPPTPVGVMSLDFTRAPVKAGQLVAFTAYCDLNTKYDLVPVTPAKRELVQVVAGPPSKGGCGCK